MLKGPIKTNKNQSRTKKTLGKPKKPNISRSGDIGAGWLGRPGLAGWLAEDWFYLFLLDLSAFWLDFIDFAVLFY